jgi:hypothetical protein
MPELPELPKLLEPKKLMTNVKGLNHEQLQAEVAKNKILEAAMDYMSKQPGFNPGEAAAFELDFGLRF